MNTQDLNNLIRWSVDVDGERFAKEIYKDNDGRVFIDEYVVGKFHDMQRNLISWIASLDKQRRQNLCDAVNNNQTNERVK